VEIVEAMEILLVLKEGGNNVSIALGNSKILQFIPGRKIEEVEK
jgi:hypothetical protein